MICESGQLLGSDKRIAADIAKRSWVPSSACSGSGCGTHAKYTAKSSSTSKAVTGKTLDVQYGDGSTASGPVYSDSVTVGGLTATGQTFGTATTLTGNFGSSPSDGLVGMAYPALSQLGVSPFFNTLWSEGRVAANSFSFRLATQNSAASELYLGGLNSAKYVAGTTGYTPVISQTYWAINTNVAVNGQAVSGLGTLAAIADTGTTLIVVSRPRVRQRAARVRRAQLSLRHRSRPRTLRPSGQVFRAPRPTPAAAATTLSRATRRPRSRSSSPARRPSGRLRTSTSARSRTAATSASAPLSVKTLVSTRGSSETGQCFTPERLIGYGGGASADFAVELC